MSREKRIILENGIYHVITRGNRGNDIFLTDNDRNYFLKTLYSMSKEYAVDIFFYTLMNNHYHILLRSTLPNLPDFMQRLNLIYTKYFNYTHGLSGHLFQDRYKSFLVKENKYLIAVMRYIALNPVLSGITAIPESYQWGSYRFLFEKEIPDWLKVFEVLKISSLRKKDFIFLVESFEADLEDYLKFEAAGKLSKNQVQKIILSVEHLIGDISNNKKLRDTLIFYLVSLGAKQKDISKILNVSGRNVRRIFSKTAIEIEKGNYLYTDILRRIKNVLLVPGTNRTKIGKKVENG